MRWQGGELKNVVHSPTSYFMSPNSENGCYTLRDKGHVWIKDSRGKNWILWQCSRCHMFVKHTKNVFDVWDIDWHERLWFQISAPEQNLDMSKITCNDIIVRLIMQT